MSNQRVETTMEFKSPIGFQLAFGAVLTGLGCFFLLFTITTFSQARGIGPVVILSGFGLIGALLAAVGLLCLIVRRRTQVNPSERTVAVCWRILNCVKCRTPVCVSDQAEVRLNCYNTSSAATSRGRGGGRPQYHVSIGEPGGTETTIAAYPEFIAGRQAAEQVARRLTIPLVDLSSPRRVARAPTELDENLTDRLNRANLARDCPPPPPDCRIRMEFDGFDTRFHLPRFTRSEAWVNIAGIAMLAVGWGAGAAFMLRSFGNIAVLIGAGSIPVVLAVASMFFLLCRETVVASKQRLSVVRRYPVGRTRVTIAAGELEELLARGDQLVARCDTQEVRFGDGLTPRERRWLLRAIESCLVHGKTRLNG